MFVNSSAAHKRHIKEAEKRGANQCANNKLTNGASFGNTGDKTADKGPPRDPPCPVEDGPATKLFGIAIPESLGEKVVEVNADGITHIPHDKNKSAEYQEE